MKQVVSGSLLLWRSQIRPFGICYGKSDIVTISFLPVLQFSTISFIAPCRRSGGLAPIILNLGTRLLCR